MSGAKNARSVVRSAASSSRLPVPGVRVPRLPVRHAGNPFPSWASSSLGLARSIPCRLRSATIPPRTFERLSDLRPRTTPVPRGVDRIAPGSTARAERPLRGSSPIVKEPALSSGVRAPPGRLRSVPRLRTDAAWIEHRVVKEQPERLSPSKSYSGSNRSTRCHHRVDILSSR
jgi:hypothetical protein